MAKLTMEYPQYRIQQRSKKEHSLGAYKSWMELKGIVLSEKKPVSKSHILCDCT